jgi:threonyl-tRNA synthetase
MGFDIRSQAPSVVFPQGATMADYPDLKTLRRSGACLMAAAIRSSWPQAAFGCGSVTEIGFFYDVDLPEPLKASDLALIERRIGEMRELNLPFERVDVPIDDAIRLMERLGQTYKVELLQLLKAGGSAAVANAVGEEEAVGVCAEGGSALVALCRMGDFVDLCRGPLLSHSGQVGPIKLRNIAGAYWRGDSSRRQLQRIHALCFPNQPDLDAAIERLREAAEHDHRKLGRELKLFMLSPDVGAGLPLWLPNGMVIRDELERLALQEERRDGYRRVATPHITREALYVRSGHLPYYRDDMYAPIDIEGEAYFLRPMNCPHHHEIYLSQHWSYRQLPVRLSEYGQVYRYEASGGLSGLMRTRGFCQNDAHIYCRPDQAREEFLAVMRLHARYYAMFGIEDFWMRLSLPDMGRIGKYVDDPNGWMESMAILREAMDASGYRYVEAPGEAAFYGPKVDFMIRSAIGSEHAISTNQLDFVAARRFGLNYAAADGEMRPVYVIHRAPLGSHERFVAFLIEHYGGAFPVWLAPLQVRVIPVSERHTAYALKVRDLIFEAVIPTASGGARVDADLDGERMQRKIRNAQQEKIPYVLVVGDRETESSFVSVRRRGGSSLGTMPVPMFLSRLAQEIGDRRDIPAA